MSRDARDLLDTLRDESAAGGEDVEKLRALFPEDLSTLREETGPFRSARSRWLLLGAGLAAAAALVVAANAPTSFGHVDAALSERLDSAGQVQRLDIGAAVAVDYQGSGLVEGSTLSPVIGWEQGILVLDVDPRESIDLTVNTSEARVKVKGTVLSVQRDALGTHVTVDRGLVGVTCLGTEEVDVAAGGEHICLPGTAGGLLGRARALQDSGGAPSEILPPIDMALALVDEASPLNSELRVLRIQLRYQLGESGQALAEAREFLATDTSLRRKEVARLALHLSVLAGDCADAAELLDILGDGVSDAERDALERCVTQREP